MGLVNRTKRLLSHSEDPAFVGNSRNFAPNWCLIRLGREGLDEAHDPNPRRSHLETYNRSTQGPRSKGMPRHVKSALALITAFMLAAAAGAFAESHVRIVRLSYLNGQVQTDRATGQGLERAILNTPIVQGMRVETGNDGLAEVEFENASALRIAENSEIQFRGLSMNDNGAKINEIEVVKGVVYLDARSKGDDIYRLKSGDSTFLVQRDTQFRLSVGPEQTRLAVFKGNVELMDQLHVVNVQRKQTLTLDPLS